METFLLVILQVVLLIGTSFSAYYCGFDAGIRFEKNLQKPIKNMKEEYIRRLEEYAERLEKERRRKSDGY